MHLWNALAYTTVTHEKVEKQKNYHIQRAQKMIIDVAQIGFWFNILLTFFGWKRPKSNADERA